MTNVRFIILALIALFSANVFAQTGISSDGRDFYLVMMTPSQSRPNADPNYSFGGEHFKPSVLITSLSDNNTIAMTYYDESGNEVSPYSFRLKAHESRKIALDPNKMEIPAAGEQSMYKSCHIVSRSPINVQYFSTGYCSGGSYLALPVQCLGKKYVVMSYHDNASGLGGVFNSNPSSGFCIITAAFDNTLIQVTPNSTTYGGKSGVRCGVGANLIPQPFIMNLQHGQSYMFKSAGKDDNCDISGSTIVSNKPVSVVAGHENAHTDVSDEAGLSMDERDFMVEQLLPVECFDTSGYYTTPFYEPSDLPDATGDEVRFFCNGTDPSTIAMTYDGNNKNIYSSSPYPNPVPGKTSIINGAQYYSTNKQPFSIMMYDQRAQSTFYASPSPSMMSIIPRSHWKSEYLFQVSEANFETKFQAYYINVICQSEDWNKGNIFVGINGANPVSLRGAGLSIKKTTYGVGGSDLVSVVFVVTPGAYYFSNIGFNYKTNARNTFAVYRYDYHAFDADNDLGDFGPDHTFTSNANPTGMSYFEYGAPTPKNFSATVVDNCDSWSICVTDTGSSLNGIKYIELINYPNTSYHIVPPQSRNVGFDAVVDPYGKNDICLLGNDQYYCFTVMKLQSPDQCEAVVAIYDNSGERVLIDLPKPVTPLLTSRGNLLQQSPTTFQFKSARVDSAVCGTVVIKCSDIRSIVNVIIKDIHVPDDALRFHFTSTLPVFPLTLRTTDSLVLNFCYVPTDTLQRQTTITVTTTCPTPFAYSLIGKAKTGIIDATDIAFSSTLIKTVQCKQLSIKNIGTTPFAITGYTHSDTSNFSIDPKFISSLPLQLLVGMTVPVNVCFNPATENTFTDTIHWLTDIPDLYHTKIKSFSQLTAKSSTQQNAVAETDAPLFSAQINHTSLSILLPPELINQKLSIELFDLLGRSIHSWNNNSPEHSLTLAIATISSGTYLVRVTAEGKHYSKLVIVAP